MPQPPDTAGGPFLEFDDGVLRRYSRLVDATALFLVCLGAAVLVGWLAGDELVTRVLPDAIPMKPNTAVCVIFTGLALRTCRTAATPWCRRIGIGGATVVVLITTVTLIQYVTGVDVGVDRLLLGWHPHVADAPDAGRMAPNTAVGWLLLGSAQLVLLAASARYVVLGQSLSLVAGAFGMLGLYGYAYRIPELESPLGMIAIAVHTALALTIASAATFLARPTAGWARMLATRAKSAMMTRRMLAATILVPPTLGWLRLIAEGQKLVGTPLGVALLVASNVATFMIVTFITGNRAVRLELARRRAEAELAWRGAAAAMAEAAPDAMVGVDGDGDIVLVNAEAQRLFGYRREEMIGQPVELLVPEAARRAHPAYRAAYLVDPYVRRLGLDATLSARRKDGTEIPVEISLSAPESDGRRLVVAAVHDVTERLRYEEELREKNVQLEQANQAKDAFLAAMSHELRTPLNAIIGFTGTLLMGLPGPLNEEQTHQLRMVEAGGRHLLSLINDVLDLAKIEAGQLEVAPERIDCAATVRGVAESLRPLADHKGILLITDVPDGECVATVDRRALSQILINLVDNAIKFTTAGEVRVRLARPDTAAPWALTVADTGPGIHPAEQARIFEAFHRTADARGTDGAGLGLYISRTLAELMGCRMRLSSTPGDGSTFTLTLAA